MSALFREGADRSLLREATNAIRWVEGDILDVLSLEKALEEVDYVIHAAAVVSFSPRDRNRMLKINVEGTANVVNACLHKGKIKLCYLSSVAALGRPDLLRNPDARITIDESQQWVDSPSNSAYAKSKYLAELEVWRGVSEGLNAVIVNPSVVLGEGDPGKSSTRLFKYVWDEKPFYTDGTINYVDVSDLTSCISSLLFSDVSGERFIISSGSTGYYHFFNQIARSLEKRAPHIRVQKWLAGMIWRVEYLRSVLTGSHPLITRESSRAALHNFHYSNQKIRQFTGLSFKSLEETTQRIAKTFKPEV